MARHGDYQPIASDEPVYEIDSFELIWAKYKFAIIGGAVAIVAIIAGVFAWITIDNANRAKAAAAFAEATDPAAYRGIIEQYPKSPVAGNAALLLAGSLRQEGKLDEANAVLQKFVDSQPKSAFAPLAKIAIAENKAKADDLKQAEQELQSVADVDSQSFAAPFALMLEAELQLATWNRNEALRTYRQLFTAYPGSVSAQASAPQYDALDAMSRPISERKSPPNAAALEQAAPEAEAPAGPGSEQ